MRYDALSDSVGKCASLASRATAAHNGEHVERAKDAGELERAYDTLAVDGRREELVERDVVDEDRRRRNGDMWPVGRRRKSIVHDRREEIIGLSCWLLLRLRLLLADRDHPDARGALFALSDGVRTAMAVEGHLFAGCAREDYSFVVSLEEVEYGLDALGQRVVSCDAGDARAFFEVGQHGYHAAVARGRECAIEHRHHALAFAPEVLCWREGGARECG